jgi:hypothetical protein
LPAAKSVKFWSGLVRPIITEGKEKERIIMPLDPKKSLFDPETFSEGGFGLGDGFDEGKVVDVVCCIHEFKRKDAMGQLVGTGDKSPAVMIKMVNDDHPGTAEKPAYEAIISLSGKDALENFAPSPDGTTLVSLRGKTFNKKSKIARFFTSLINAGYPRHLLGNHKNMIGYTFAFTCEKEKMDNLRKGQTKGDGTVDTRDQMEVSYPLVERIISAPGSGAIVGAGSVVPQYQQFTPPPMFSPAPLQQPQANVFVPPVQMQAPVAASSSINDPLTTEVIEKLKGILSVKGSLQLVQAVTEMFAAMGGGAGGERASNASKLVYNQEFLKSGAAMGMWNFDGNNITKR